MILKKEFYKFLVLNFLLLSLVFFFIFRNEPNQTIFYTSIIISVPIIIFQYIILRTKKNWSDYAIVLYLGMCLYLFILGVVVSWNISVGFREKGSFIGLLDGGIRVLIFGNFIGLVSGFPILLIFNFLLKKWIFTSE